MNPIFVTIIVFVVIILTIIGSAILLNLIELTILLIGRIFNLDTKIDNDRPTEISVTTKIIEDNRNFPSVSTSKLSVNGKN